MWLGTFMPNMASADTTRFDRPDDPDPGPSLAAGSNQTNDGHEVDPVEHEMEQETATVDNSSNFSDNEAKDSIYSKIKCVGSSRRKQREPQKLKRTSSLVLNNNDDEQDCLPESSLEQNNLSSPHILHLQCNLVVDNLNEERNVYTYGERCETSNFRAYSDDLHVTNGCELGDSDSAAVADTDSSAIADTDSAQKLTKTVTQHYVQSILGDIGCEPGETEDGVSDDADDQPRIPIGKCVNLRRSYTREEKIQVLDWYYKNGRNKYKTSKLFALNTRTLGKWIAAEKKIRRSREGSMRAGSGRRPFWMEMEDELHRLYKEEVRRSGGESQVPHVWFRENSEKIMRRLEPSSDFKFTTQWLAGFKRRFMEAQADTVTEPSMVATSSQASGSFSVGRKRGRPRKISDDSYTVTVPNLNAHYWHHYAMPNFPVAPTNGLLSSFEMPHYDASGLNFDGMQFRLGHHVNTRERGAGGGDAGDRRSNTVVTGHPTSSDGKSLLKPKPAKEVSESCADAVSAVVNDIHHEYSLRQLPLGDAGRRDNEHNMMQTSESLGRCLQLLANSCGYAHIPAVWNGSPVLDTPLAASAKPAEPSAPPRGGGGSPAPHCSRAGISPDNGVAMENGDVTAARGASWRASGEEGLEQCFKIGRSGVHRKSYTREEKLHVLDWYNTHGKNKYRTCKLFGLNTRMLGKWVKAEEKIRCSRRGAMKVGSGRKPFWKDMEDELYLQYLEQVEKLGSSKFITLAWFRTKSEGIMSKLHPEVEFKFSYNWLEGFRHRYLKEPLSRWLEYDENQKEGEWSGVASATRQRQQQQQQQQQQQGFPDDHDDHSSGVSVSDSGLGTSKTAAGVRSSSSGGSSSGGSGQPSGRVELRIPTVPRAACAAQNHEATPSPGAQLVANGDSAAMSNFAVSQLIQLGALYSILGATCGSASAVPPQPLNLSTISYNNAAERSTFDLTRAMQYGGAAVEGAAGDEPRRAGRSEAATEESAGEEERGGGGEEGGVGMAVGQQRNVRKSYTREEKLQVLDWYQRNGRNKYRTAKMFGMNIRTLSKWVHAEDAIRRSRHGSMKAGSGRRPYWPDMEQRLHALYKEEEAGRRRRRQGGGDDVPASWYQHAAETIMRELHPRDAFSFSLQWLERFKRRYGISLQPVATATAAAAAPDGT
ncbi:PREDICTED: uncharacterized protein LOC106805471 [Priapulus caudatus]|uniref:Uncharacterized protein LOC106805471 n=1 Tax=Priapulus caudatus TaxID=37621 RepID=A0ABM1DRH9_PRICU|nr:PREDICTED: uncharacterized protein LOC106805471 [Priapulus caudatus]